MITTVLFDFGGVIAEEGFFQGLREIARRNGRAPEDFFVAVERIIHECGYLTGRNDESAFWDMVRRETGIHGADRELRELILERFVLRPEMLAAVDKIRDGGRLAAMLSDQTNWLEELDARTPFFGHFDRIFNSFRIHKSKRDPSVFPEVCSTLDVRPGSVLFIDDNEGHVQRAASQGLQTVRFTTSEAFEQAIHGVLGENR